MIADEQPDHEPIPIDPPIEQFTGNLLYPTPGKITTLAAEPLQTSNYMTARREMNSHDFFDPAEGGERLCSAMDSARRELGFFMEERGLWLAEPFEVRITIEVTARTEPVPE